MSEAGPLIYITVGEPSGDQLAAHLVRALREATQGRVRFAGLAGERMREAGLESLFPISELALMGLEVVPKLPRLLRRISQTAADIRARRPDALVMVDAQTFSQKIGEKLKGSPFPILQYVAPTVWAWKPGRAEKVARYLARVLTIFPFEAPYFEKHGLPVTFVGHPAAEAAGAPADGAGLRARLGLGAGAPLLVVLPGSRRGEIKFHLPILGEAMDILAKRFPDLRAVAPTVPPVAESVAAAARGWAVPTTVLTGPAEKYAAFAAGTAALAASGTVTVETAFADLPTVVLYKAPRLTAEIARMVIRVDYGSGTNLVVGRPVFPEYIQDHCRPGGLADAVSWLIENEHARAAQRFGMAEARRRFAVPGETPSRAAARAVLTTIEEWRRTHGS